LDKECTHDDKPTIASIMLFSVHGRGGGGGGGGKPYLIFIKLKAADLFRYYRKHWVR
jgi:hypothetical protein